VRSSRVAGWAETLEADIDRILEVHKRVISGLAEMIETLGHDSGGDATSSHVRNSEDRAIGYPIQEVDKRKAV
jgi:hypothetical protein